MSTRLRLFLHLLLIIVFFLLLDLQYWLALRQAGIEIVLGNFLVHQVLVTIDTRGAFRLHFRMRGLG